MQATNNKNIALALAVFLATDTYDYNPDPKSISTTTLLKPTRALLLEIGLSVAPPLAYDISGNIDSAMGSAIHEGIERSWLNNYEQALLALGYPKRMVDKIVINPATHTAGTLPVYLEQRLTKSFLGWTVTGKMDFVIDGKVEDFKNTSVYQVQNDLIRDKTIKQLSILRWLDPDMIVEDSGTIHYIIKDWRAMEVYQDNYPPLKFHSETVPLMPVHEVEHFITDKIQTLDRLKGKDQSLFPACTDEDLWKRPPDKPFKYYKNPANKSRSTKNFATMAEAQARLAKDGNVGTIVTVTGEPKACKYCPVISVCNQAKAMIASGELKLGN